MKIKEWKTRGKGEEVSRMAALENAIMRSADQLCCERGNPRHCYVVVVVLKKVILVREEGSLFF